VGNVGKFSDYDLPRRKFDFFEDLKYGKKGEELVAGFLDSLSAGAFEVKTDRYRNGRMVFEIEHNPRKRKDENGKAVWEPSGLSVTKAAWWVYVYTLNGSEGAFLIVSVPRIKRYLDINKDRFNRSTMKDFARGSSNPSRGFLLEPEDVMDLLTNAAYDEVRTEA
jgi:hypothetical protein